MKNSYLSVRMSVRAPLLIKVFSSFEAMLATSTTSKVKKFFIIAFLILKPLFHTYELTESMEALIEDPTQNVRIQLNLKKEGGHYENPKR